MEEQENEGTFIFFFFLSSPLSVDSLDADSHPDYLVPLDV